MITTVGQILVNDAIPEEFRDHNRVMTKGEADKVLAEVARKYPDRYREISKRLMELGRHASFEEGTTLRLSDLQEPMDMRPVLAQLHKQENAIKRDRTMTPEQKQDAIEVLFGETHQDIQDQTMAAASAKGNPMAFQVKSKARGSPLQLAAMLATPGIYQDAKGRTIPVFIDHSYAHGLDPHEYFAATYGARTGTLSTKFSTRRAGYIGKLMGAAVMDSVVTESDCGTPFGIPVKADDKDNIGSVLARPMSGFPAGTVIDHNVMSKLQKDKVDQIVVRSPITCGTHKGICQHCAGIRESGDFPEIGYHIGLNAASALAEQIAQQSLNCLSFYTQVLCSDWSTKMIKDIKAGDTVMGCGVDGVMRPVKVLNVFDNGPRECYRTSFIVNGQHHGSAQKYILDATLEHKILGTRRVAGQQEESLNFVPRILPVGTKSKHFYASPLQSFDDTGLKDEPLDLLLGNLLGDGCYTESVNAAHLSSADTLQVDQLREYLAPLGLGLTKLDGHSYYYRVGQIGLLNGTNTPNPVRRYLEDNGMWGKYAHEKEIPGIVDTWSNKSVARLLAGLFVTDGSVYTSDGNEKPGISFASTSAKLLEGVQRLLFFRFGILSSSPTITKIAGAPITTLGHAKEYFTQHDMNQITITSWSSVRRFNDAIPLIGVKKQKLDDMVSRFSQEKGNYTGFRRISQEFIGMVPTFDIEVDHPDHLFVLANGLVVSNSKHSGRKASGTTTYAGFDVIKNLATVPSTFPDKAAVAEIGGTVQDIKEAPQGGYYMNIGDQQHYVATGLPLMVKEGDTVEPGDQLSDGILNPSDAVRLKGIGEGRRYFANRMTQAFRETNLGAHRRNAEVLARSVVNHVQINDQDAAGEHLPGDVITYSNWAYGYKPRTDAARVSPKQAVGQYLEEPALHYTIGTRVTKSVQDTLQKHGAHDVLVHPNPVGVDPTMVSVVNTPEYTDDWMAHLSSSYLQSRLLNDVHSAATSTPHGVHPIPGIALGTEFGQQKGKTFTY